MSEQNRMQLQFWGVRGAIPIPCTDKAEFGGNTACLELRLPSGEVLIFDGGSGVRALGDQLKRDAAGKPMSLHLFLTHFHWDHIQGIPFFEPLYVAENDVTFCSFPRPERLRDILSAQMAPPYYPVSFEFMPAGKNFTSMAEDSLRVGGAVVRSFPLNHPQHAFGYRIDANGSSVVFATDHEHGERKFDLSVRRAAEGADVLIFDAQYTPEEYESKRGWGHSTWLEATRVARDSVVKRLILFHHDPGHSDRTMREILLRACQCFPNTEIATERHKILV